MIFFKYTFATSEKKVREKKYFDGEALNKKKIMVLYCEINDIFISKTESFFLNINIK